MMIRLNETEEIIRLIYNGFDLELLSFELDIPIEKLQEYKKRLELRQFAKESIKNGKITEAIDKLNNFIETTDSNIIEKTILLKLKAYANKTMVNKEDLLEIENEKKKLGFSSDIDQILRGLNVQISKIKSSNIRKKEKKYMKEHLTEEEQYEKEVHEEYLKPDYEEDKAREELIALAEESSSYMAYRQLVHIEKKIGNLEEAKLWAYEALGKFPNSIEIREQLISIAREEKDDQEVIKQLRDIIEINPKNKKNKNKLKTIIDREEK